MSDAEEYQGSADSWLNLDNLRVFLTRLWPNEDGEIVVNIQGGRVTHDFKWFVKDEFFYFDFFRKRLITPIRILTPEFLKSYTIALDTHYLEDGLAPMFFNAMDALEGKQVIRIVHREDGVFDSLVGGSPIGANGTPKKCNGCRAYAACPFRLQGCYTICDPELALNVIAQLTNVYESYRKRRDVRPASTEVLKSGERPGPYSYSKRENLLR
jgi:hypothetical protein